MDTRARRRRPALTRMGLLRLGEGQGRERRERREERREARRARQGGATSTWDMSVVRVVWLSLPVGLLTVRERQRERLGCSVCQEVLAESSGSPQNSSILLTARHRLGLEVPSRTVVRRSH